MFCKYSLYSGGLSLTLTSASFILRLVRMVLLVFIVRTFLDSYSSRASSFSNTLNSELFCSLNLRL
jgi:hypothetical protein